MIIHGAWALESVPDRYVLDVPDLGLRLVKITPFRYITDADLAPYIGCHPRRLRGTPLPNYLYRFYGLERGEGKTEMLHIRVTSDEKSNIELAARDAGTNVADYVRSILFDYGRQA